MLINLMECVSDILKHVNTLLKSTFFLHIRPRVFAKKIFTIVNILKDLNV